MTSNYNALVPTTAKSSLCWLEDKAKTKLS